MPVLDTFAAQAADSRKSFLTEPLIRSANFHNTPRYREREFVAQLEWWSRHFSPVDQHELDSYLQTGAWHKPKPGLIIALFNGYRNQYDVMLPLLERFGFVGWFYVPTAFASEPAATQGSFIKSRTLKVIPNEYADGRYALNWDELRTLDKKHVVASHTRNHAKLATDDAYMENEIVGPQRDFERELGHRVRAFAWLSGAAYGEEPAADRRIDAAGYQFVVSNYKIQRIRDWPAGARG